MRSEQNLKDVLKEHQFLAGLEEHHFDTLASVAELHSYHADEHLFRTGKPADHCFLIREGRVVIELYHPPRGAIRIDTLEANAVIGWSWLIPPYRWSFDGRALDLTRAIALDASRLRKIFDEDKAFGYDIGKRFVELLGDRLQSTRLLILDMFGKDADLDSSQIGGR